MKKNYTLGFFTFLLTFCLGFGQGSETFTNLNAPTGSYSNGSYVGDNGVTWTYDGARDVNATYQITSTTIGFGTTSAGTRNVTASSGANGVGDLTYSVRSYFTGGGASDRTIEVYVNSVLQEAYTLAAMTTVFTRTVTANISGNVTIEFRSTGSRQIALDDVSWTIASVGPSINTNPSSLSNLDYSFGTGPSAEQTVAVTGSNLVVPITINAPANFEVSNTSGSGFATSTTLPIAGGTLYVRLAQGLAVNTYSGNLSLSSTGATTITVAVDGEVTPPLADVVITEIMYNTPGANDYEWIEICNITGVAQDISSYTIDRNGTTFFTFPGSTSIAAGNCITVLLGHVASSPAPECPFTPDYQNPIGTTNILQNGGNTIELVAADGVSVADVVAYDDADSAATDGLGSTFHVIDATMDNSDTATNWQAVPDGGSPGINSLVSPCTVFDPDINVEGDVGTFPDIADGDTTPQGTDNTLFGTFAIGSSGDPNQTKSYRIQNLGAGDLTITNITTTGPNPGDFTVDPSLVFPITIAPSSLITFEVTFIPLAAGTRNATVRIENDDPDTAESIYTYSIRGTGSCAASSIALSPNNGPVGTIVTVTGANFGGSTTASINAIDASASIVIISPTVLEVTIPVGADTAFLEVIDESGCAASETFTVLTDDITTCEGNAGSIPATWTSLMISGLFDNSSGSCHYMELFNPTISAINLSGYNIRLANNATTADDAFGYTSSAQSLSGTVAAESTFMIQFGNTGSTCSDCPNISPDLVITDSAFGINGTGSGGVDRVVLLNGTSEIDMVANTDYANAGYVYQRNTTATAPQDPTSTSYNSLDWTGQGTADCFGFQIPNFVDPPLVTLNPSASTSCDLTATLNVAADEGYNGSGDSQELAYQWYYHAPGDTSWTAVPDNATFDDVTTAVLTINNVLNAIDYQFYCQIREDDAACYSSSEATRLDVQRVTWSGTAWSGTPDINTIAIISGNYNTSIGGAANQISFEACNLIIDAAVELIVANSDYVRVANNVINNGTVTVRTQGSFVQDGIDGAAGTYTNNGTSRVIKQTSDFFDDGFNYHYTYWSSPVVNADIATVFPNPRGNRRYYFDSAQYIDTDGDDISDTANDWQIATGNMEVGRGYAVTATTPPGFPYNNMNTFTGTFNTGNISKSIVLNGFSGDNDWNFIGNPYPSAIDFEELYSQNSSLIEGAAFLWSQAAPPDVANPGNEVLNFNTNDYAIITANSGNTAGGAIGLPPNDFIPSGQGFFVRGISAGTLTFKNDMRSTGSNDIFYIHDTIDFQNRNNNPSSNRLWLDLTSDNGIFSQILVAYVAGGTDDFDDWSYDAPRNLSTGTYASFYSIIQNDERKFAIQGKNPESLVLEEVIKLGFINSINEPTLYKISIPLIEGEFMENNTIYLQDHLLEVVHDLSDSDYNFTSEVGEFNDRFEIVFTLDPLSVDELAVTASDLIIIDLNESDVTFKINGSHSLQTIKIIDLLGRTLYYFDGINASERTFNLSNLSQATYIAEVTLSNGQVVTKKAIKRN